MLVVLLIVLYTGLVPLERDPTLTAVAVLSQQGPRVSMGPQSE